MASNAPPITTHGALPSDLDGTFAVLLQDADVAHADEAGFWYLRLSPSGGYSFGHPPSLQPENTSVLTVSNASVSFSGERGSGACEGAGTYHWTAAGDAVTFTVDSDTCSVRVKQMTARSYLRCPAGPDTCVRPR